MLNMKYCVIPKQNEKHFNIDHFYFDIVIRLRDLKNLFKINSSKVFFGLTMFAQSTQITKKEKKTRA